MLFVWRGRAVSAYRVFLALALAVGAEALVAQARSGGMPTGATLAWLAVVLVAIPAWARLLFLVSRPRERRSRPSGGAAAFGGVLALVVLGPPLALAFGLPLGRFLDAVALAALPGIAVVRFGCVLNGCCAGHRTSSRLGLAIGGQRRLPVPLLESGLALALIGPLVLLRAAGAPAGTVFLAACFGYGAVGFGLHFLRPRTAVVLGLAQAQLLGAAVCAGSAAAALALAVAG